jgi:outer membrane protein TolC
MKRLLILLIVSLIHPRAAVALDDAAAASSSEIQESPSLLRLSLKRAVEIALAPDGNTRIALAEESIRIARARSAQSRSALLPTIEGSVGQQNITRNLEAFGIRFSLPIPGASFPSFVGPFNVFDARVTLTQPLLDLPAIRRLQASRAGVELARAENGSAQDQVRALVARSYLAAIRARDSLETERANVKLAEALLDLAVDRKNAGTATGIEVTRARVQLANERQRLLVAENESRAAHLKLMEVLGLKMDAHLELTEPLVRHPVDAQTPADALQTALESRLDWKAQQEREESRRLLHSAAGMERLPSIRAFADYGSIGTSIDRAVPTRAYGVLVRIPVFEGGRIESHRVESGAELQQEKARTLELRRRIELEIRLALDALRSAAAQIQAAEEGQSLAENELAQARRRYEAGMTSNIEITDAQTRLQRARENTINALFNHNLARIDLMAAMGTIRKISE